MSYPIWDQEKRARNPRSHVADAILFLASGRSATTAQPTTEPGEDVTVFAPYIIKRKSGPGNVQTISVSRNVSFHDLDLRISRDATALEQRVNQAAQDVCRELDSRYGSGVRKRISEDRFGAPHAFARALGEIQAIAAATRTR
jgi:UrcA family protein